MKSSIRTFLYSIKEKKISLRNIKINTDESIELDDLRKKIASEEKIPIDELQFINPPKGNLKSILEYTPFELTCKVVNKSLEIELPNGNKFKFQNYKIKNFDDIFEFLQGHKFYYSQKCIEKNFHINSSGSEITEEKLSSLDKDALLKVCMTGKFVNLEYGQYQFNFCERESISEVKNFFQKVFTFPNLLKIQNDYGQTPVRLKSTEQYTIQIESEIKFTIFENDSICVRIDTDYMITVFDAQKKLTEKLNNFSQRIEPEQLELYDHNRKLIDDLKKPLSRIQNLNLTFYFKINSEIKISYEPITDKKISTPKTVSFASTATSHPGRSPSAATASISPSTKTTSTASMSPSTKTTSTASVSPPVKALDGIKDSIIITIIFDDVKIGRIKASIPLNTKISDLQSMISRKYKIKDNITIRYKSGDMMVILNPNLEINEVTSQIKEKDDKGNAINVLHVKIEQKPKPKPKPSPKVETKKSPDLSSSESMSPDDESKLKLASKKRITPDSKVKTMSVDMTFKSPPSPHSSDDSEHSKGMAKKTDDNIRRKRPDSSLEMKPKVTDDFRPEEKKVESGKKKRKPSVSSFRPKKANVE